VRAQGREADRRYDHVVTDRWWLRPLVAAVLGALPFLVFVGTSQTSTVNGETVLDSQFNILGLARNDRDRLILQAELFRARFGG
jgi:hypothetical protein